MDNEIKIKAQINKLGPIQDAFIEFAPFMLFTGKSNLGKSYTNFLSFYVFHLFADNRLHGFLSDKIIGKIKGTKFEINFSVGQLRKWMHDDVRQFFANLLNYSDINCDVVFIFDEFEDNTKLSFSFDKIIQNKTDDFSLKDMTAYVVNFESNIMPIISFGEMRDSLISQKMSVLLSRKFLGRNFSRSILMPPGRAVLVDSSYTVQSAASSIGMYDKFLKDYDYIVHGKRFERSVKEDSQFFISRIQKLIHGSIFEGKDGVIIKLEQGGEIPLSTAASSIKELSPLLFFIQNLQIQEYSVCIEEPEAHAHPEMQRDIADLLVACIQRGSFMQVTTHSDYFLSRLNQLISLFKLHNDKLPYFIRLQEEYNISPRVLLNPDIVKAYYFKYRQDGSSVEIEQQDVSNGIPFTTFSNVINEQYATDEFINAGLENDEDVK